MDCEFYRFHYEQPNKFDKTYIYGDIRIGIVIFSVRNQTYYCVDLLNLETLQHMHMDNRTFEKCVERLSILSEPNIILPRWHTDNDLIIRPIPFTNSYKVIHGNQRMIFDTNSIIGMNDISKWVNFTWR